MIQTRALSFSYARQEKGIDDIYLEVPDGSCFGLLGQNGAGKSTLMKLILGLLKPKQGEVFLQKQMLNKAGVSLYKEVGALVESPALYTHLSAYDNLSINSIYRGINQSRIEEVLERVALNAYAHQKVSTYSTGMKQRLGIALALLHDPKLLILDEPVNGLDPEGIVTIRKLIRSLQQEGKTILLSSHLLHEIELSCDYVGILQEGKLLYQGRIKDLQQQNYAHQPLCIKTNDNIKARQLLSGAEFFCQQDENGLLINIESKDQISVIIDLLRAQQIAIYTIIQQEARLEDLYFRFTKTYQHEVIKR